MAIIPLDFPYLLEELVTQIDPAMPVVSSRLTWRCKEGHPPWESTFRSRAVQRSGCPYCSGRLPIPGVNDLLTMRPELVEEFDYDRNAPKLPEHFKEFSSQKIWWKCRQGHPSWEAIVANRSNGKGCPYCSGRMSIPGESDLKSLYPRLALEWDSVRNVLPEPVGVSPNANKKFWWECPVGHSYEASPNNRVSRGSGCP